MGFMQSNYSEVLYCVYDGCPSRSKGNGWHHAVFQAVVWHDTFMRPLTSANVHNFAVIWDEDHDTRIIDVVEDIYMRGLLPPILFIGERRGCVVAILDANFISKSSDRDVAEYKRKIMSACQNAAHGDPWTVTFGWFDPVPSNGSYEVYLGDLVRDVNAPNLMCDIHMEFRLGLNDFVSIPRKHPAFKD